MRLLFWIVAIPLIAIAMSFGVSNPESVELRLWPLVHSVAMPLYAAVAIALFFGILLGALVAWLDGLRHRAEARRLARRLRELEADDAKLRRELAIARDATRLDETQAQAAQDEAARRLTVAQSD